jgi:DNA-binding beta-propeller fold protein YncE
VVVDARGVASTGTVTRIDLGTLATTDTIGVGLHPTAIVWDEPGERLYVANGNGDSVSVIDTRRMAIAQTFAIAPFAVPPVDNYEITDDVPHSSPPDLTLEQGLKQAFENRADLRSAERTGRSP